MTGNEPSMAELRRRADAELASTRGAGRLAALSEAELRRLVHELEVHELELKLQNEALTKSQRELELAHLRFRDLFRFAPVAYLTLDSTGRILEANLAATELLDAPRERVVGQVFTNFVARDDVAVWSRGLAEAVAARTRRSVELVVDPPGGQSFAARLDAIAIVGTDDAPRLHCALTDTSQQRRTEDVLREAKEAAEAASAAKTKFLARMSHELRTPMSSIYLSTELALQEELPPRARRFLKLANQACQALLTVIADTLDISKIEAGHVELADIDFELRAAIESGLEPLRVSAAAKGLEFSLSLDPALPRAVHGDPGRLSQVLINLVGNAIKFTASGGVRVSVAPAEEPAAGGFVRIHVTVMDTGVGFPPVQATSLFGSYFQAEPALRDRHSGTGLGLAIAKELVELMGGEIWATSEPGSGSTFEFTIELGLTATPPRAEPPADADTSPPRRRRVLLADDDLLCREVGCAVLSNGGYEVSAVADGVELLEELARGAYDVIILDLHMPRLGGVETAKRIRGGRAPLGGNEPIIIGLTAVSLVGDRERCLSAGMDECLVKPLDLARLREALRAAERRRGG